MHFWQNISYWIDIDVSRIINRNNFYFGTAILYYKY